MHYCFLQTEVLFCVSALCSSAPRVAKSLLRHWLLTHSTTRHSFEVSCFSQLIKTCSSRKLCVIEPVNRKEYTRDTAPFAMAFARELTDADAIFCLSDGEDELASVATKRHSKCCCCWTCCCFCTVLFHCSAGSIRKAFAARMGGASSAGHSRRSAATWVSMRLSMSGDGQRRRARAWHRASTTVQSLRRPR